jgi:hypothetical protein
MITTEAASRVVFCDCGIGLQGDSEEALLKAVERHIALDHGRLLHGAVPAFPSEPDSSDDQGTCSRVRGDTERRVGGRG